MAYPISIKRKAQDLRSRGYSYREISKLMEVGKGTAYVWTKDIELTIEAEARLVSAMSNAQYAAARTNKRRREKWMSEVEKKVDGSLEALAPNTMFYKILVATLYWAEGGKYDKATLKFTNSDPKMVATFTCALRRGFHIDESKLRGLVHIHEYHNDSEIQAYWSKVSSIPLSQFNKSYKKPHTGKRKREGYKGCVCIMYFDTRIAAEVHMIYNKLPKQLGAW